MVLINNDNTFEEMLKDDPVMNSLNQLSLKITGKNFYEYDFGVNSKDSDEFYSKFEELMVYIKEYMDLLASDKTKIDKESMINSSHNFINSISKLLEINLTDKEEIDNVKNNLENIQELNLLDVSYKSKWVSDNAFKEAFKKSQEDDNSILKNDEMYTIYTSSIEEDVNDLSIFLNCDEFWDYYKNRINDSTTSHEDKSFVNKSNFVPVQPSTERESYVSMSTTTDTEFINMISDIDTIKLFSKPAKNNN